MPSRLDAQTAKKLNARTATTPNAAGCLNAQTRQDAERPDRQHTGDAGAGLGDDGAQLPAKEQHTAC